MSGSFAAAVAADRASRSSGGESSGYDSPAPSGVNLTVFLTSAGRIKKCQWTGGSWKELDALYRRTFAEGRAKRFWADAGIGTGAFAPLRKELFMLRDRHYGIFYEDFDLDDLYDGAVIEVNDPKNFEALHTTLTHHLPAAMALKPSEAAAAQLEGPLAEYEEQHLQEEQREQERADGMYTDSLIKTPARSAGEAEQPEAPATFRGKVWEMLDDPTSSTGAALLMSVIMMLILFSTCTFLVETLPQFYVHNPEKYNVWFFMEAFCIGTFTLEFIARITTTPHINSYFKDFMNVIDVVAIFPFYMELMFASVNVPGLSVIRMVRLVRVFRLFKVSRGSIVVFAKTMAMSSKPLYMLVFFTSIAMVVFSSLMCYAERGIYDEDMKMWMRLHHYMCPVVVRAEAIARLEGRDPPDLSGSFILDSGHDIACERDTECGVETGGAVACFTCPYSWKRVPSCRPVYEESPFESIPAACWWCIVTMTTVGYGDMYPTGWIGKLLGCVVMMFGILVIALPITVIGSNFAVVYKENALREQAARSRIPAAPKEGGGPGMVKRFTISISKRFDVMMSSTWSSSPMSPSMWRSVAPDVSVEEEAPSGPRPANALGERGGIGRRK